MTVPINLHIKGSLALTPGGKQIMNKSTLRKVYRSNDDMTVPINRHIKGSLALTQRGENITNNATRFSTNKQYYKHTNRKAHPHPHC